MSSAHTAVQTLIERDKVDLVVAAFDSQAAVGIRPLLEQSRVPLIAADSGANLIRPGDRSPYLTYNTINAWQTSWALGDWSARTLGKNAVVVASCYESGYDTLYTFELGFTAAGGQVHNTHITHVPGRADDWPTLLRTISSANPDVVYAMYSGAEAADFATAYAGSSLAGRVPLLGRSFMSSHGAGSGDRGARIFTHTASSWNAALDTPINRKFITDYHQTTQRAADSFAVLGYDTGRLIVEAARKSSRASHLPEAIADVSFVGPRGRVQIDPAARAFNTPIYLRIAQQNGATDASQHSVLSCIHTDDPQLEAFMAAPKTGWLYPYLIA
jgi:branched-chain amino acid transport system substrate-binding protein